MPPRLDINWPDVFERYAGAKATEIARAIGVSSSSVYRAMRTHRRRPAPSKRTGTARSRIVDALRASNGPTIAGELWLPSPIDGRAISTHGRVLALSGIVGAPVGRPGPFVTRSFRSPMVKPGRKLLLSRAIMMTFNRPPRERGETVVYRSTEVAESGTRHYLANMEWSGDRWDRIIASAIPVVLATGSVAEAARRAQIDWHALMRHMVDAAGVGGSDRITAGGLTRALPIFERRVAETKSRIEDRLRWAISWDAVARKK